MTIDERNQSFTFLYCQSNAKIHTDVNYINVHTCTDTYTTK